MRYLQRLFILGLFLVVLAPLSVQAQTLIREIRIQGTERIEPATVQSYMDLKVGDPMTREAHIAKFQSCVTFGFGGQRPQLEQQLIELTDQLETVADVSVLSRLAAGLEA